MVLSTNYNFVRPPSLQLRKSQGRLNYRSHHALLPCSEQVSTETEKKNSTSPTCYFVSKHLLHFQLQQQTKNKSLVTSGLSREPRQARGPGSGGVSAIAGQFYPAPALPSSFRGWVHAQAFSYLHPMGALQPHKGEEPVTVQAQETSPCRGGGYHRVGARAS